MVKELISESFVDTYWITAEISEMRVAQNGHCYMELIEKGQRNAVPVAKARAIIWGSVFPMIRLTFEDATGQTLCAGLKVQLEVKVTFSEAYGYSLIVQDIDPAYTMGSLAQLRKEILRQLELDGVIDMNKQLPLPRPLQRIAVISSPTAAGYGDFCNQLDHNPQGYAFVHKLFAATMQGENTAASIIEALAQVADEAESWDVVVIIRGGGAAVDLACFEDYDLASVCAQFPLPIFTGIGHERDTTVLDFVAHTHLKTPTAVAAFLIDAMDAEARWIAEAESDILNYAADALQTAREKIQNMAERINHYARFACHDRESQLLLVYERICQNSLNLVRIKNLQLPAAEQFVDMAQRHIRSEQQRLESMERTISLYSPDKLLKLGYSITRVNGKVVSSPRSVTSGDVLVTTFADGTVESIVK